MSFKSLKEFGVSAERLGSICKRWMARVQRFVLRARVCVSYVEMYAKNLRYPQTFVLHVQIPVVPHSDAFTSHIWTRCLNCNDCGAS